MIVISSTANYKSNVVDNHDIKIADNLSIILIEAKYNNVYFVCNNKGLHINNGFRECNKAHTFIFIFYQRGNLIINCLIVY